MYLTLSVITVKMVTIGIQWRRLPQN